jgi:hypothetical protein
LIIFIIILLLIINYYKKMATITSLIERLNLMEQKIKTLEDENQKLKDQTLIKDTRHDNFLPKHYRKLGKGEYNELKIKCKINISDGEKYYLMLKTIVYWQSHDDGCTQITQIAYGNNMYMRKGSPFDNTWSNWVKINNMDITFNHKVNSNINCIYPLLKIMFLHNKKHNSKSQFKCHYINNMIKDEYTHDIIYKFLHTILYVIEYMDDFTKYTNKCSFDDYSMSIIKYDISNLPNIVNHLYNQFHKYKSNTDPIKSKEYVINIWTKLFENEKIKNYMEDVNRESNFDLNKIKLLLKPVVDTYKEINNVLDNAPHGKKWGYNMIIHKFIADNYPDTLYF